MKFLFVIQASMMTSFDIANMSLEECLTSTICRDRYVFSMPLRQAIPFLESRHRTDCSSPDVHLQQELTRYPGDC